MANLSSFSETPNLLELVESYHDDLSVISGLSESATCDEKTGGFEYDGPQLPSHLIDLSLCADEPNDGISPEIQAVCADEAEPVPGPLVDVNR
jgi:hypothetical protein